MDYSNDYYIYWKINQRGILWIKVKPKKKKINVKIWESRNTHIYRHDI